MLYTSPSYGKKGPQSSTDDISTYPPLGNPEVTNFIQSANGAIMAYAIACDPTMLPATSAIACESANPTQRTLDNTLRLLGYAASYPNNQLVFHKSDMVLRGYVDASYNSRAGSKSVAGGFVYFGEHPNGIVAAMSKVIKVVCASAGEAEYGGLFMQAQSSTSIRNTAEDLGHPQPATNLKVDNSFAVGLANNKIKAKHSKAIDMRYNWIQDQVRQHKFDVTWVAGQDNLADFFTKPLPAWRHKELMKLLVHTPRDANVVRSPSQIRRSREWKSRAMPT